MRRIALISDIHANLAALDDVLEDVSRRGVREVYGLGDLVGYGPDPEGVIDRIRAFGIVSVLGNWDDGIGRRRGSCGCFYADEQDRRDGEAAYAYTTRTVDDDRARWLSGRPPALRFEEHGVRVLLVHGGPRRLNEYLLPNRADGFMVKMAETAGADVVCCGHTHIPYHRTLEGHHGSIHYVNAGSVGRPADGDWRACWVELLIGTAAEVRGSVPEDPEAVPAGESDVVIGADIHRVAYNVDAVQMQMRRAGLPATLAAGLRSA